MRSASIRTVGGHRAVRIDAKNTVARGGVDLRALLERPGRAARAERTAGPAPAGVVR